MAKSPNGKLPTPSKAIHSGVGAARKMPKARDIATQPAGTSKAMAKAAVAPKVKSKLVRDSFTIPKAEYQVLDLLKLRAVNLKRPTKKSELLRAGIALLHTLSDSAFLGALNKIPSLRTGRPKATAPV